jgi:hypothetical protein
MVITVQYALLVPKISESNPLVAQKIQLSIVPCLYEKTGVYGQECRHQGVLMVTVLMVTMVILLYHNLRLFWFSLSSTYLLTT